VLAFSGPAALDDDKINFGDPDGFADDQYEVGVNVREVFKAALR